MGDDSELTVVFTGHTGLGKRRVLERLCQFIYSKDLEWCDLKGLSNQTYRKNRERALAQIYYAEDLLDEAFLYLPVRDQQELWRNSFVKAVDRWKQEKPRPKYAFLSLHVTWQARSQFFSPLAWRMPPTFEDTLIDRLKDDFRPRHCVTLIDDVYTVQKRIRERGYNFRLIELLRWRNVEMLMTDLLSQHIVPDECRKKDRKKYPFEHSPIIAVRQPLSMLYSFLFDPEKPRIYVSYPISEPRRIAERDGTDEPIEEINRFRSTLHEIFTVFDPVSIDERPMQILFNKNSPVEQTDLNTAIAEAIARTNAEGGDLAAALEASLKEFLSARLNDEIVLRAENMWPGIEFDTISEEDPTDVRLSLNEVEEIATESGEGGSEIDRQIRSRDFRLIDQADYVVVYRPTYCRDRWSGGTLEEVRYAHETGKRAIIIRDPGADGQLRHGPFSFDLAARDVKDAVPNLNQPENQARVLSGIADELNNGA